MLWRQRSRSVRRQPGWTGGVAGPAPRLPASLISVNSDGNLYRFDQLPEFSRQPDPWIRDPDDPLAMEAFVAEEVALRRIMELKCMTDDALIEESQRQENVNDDGTHRN
ncbi:MAG TPA: hypothetical protein VMV91_10810 [Rhodocyclaceae bacterium]|nr:hypothetical protein [Rhodocyclaceae bacterium]